MCRQKIIIVVTAFILAVFFLSVSAQTHVIDSIKKQISNAAAGQQKLNSILALCDQYQSLNRDTMDYYARVAKQMAYQLGGKRNIALAELAMVNSYFPWGWADSSFSVAGAALQKLSVTDAANRDVYFKLTRQKAMSLGSKSNYAEAINILYKLLEEAEMYKDTIVFSSTCNSIGSINLAMGKTSESIGWMFKALVKTNNPQYNPVLAAIYINLAGAYSALGKTDSALHYIHHSFPLIHQTENLSLLMTALRVQSNLYLKKNNVKDAESSLLELFEIKKKLGTDVIIDDNLQLADFYASTGQLKKAIEFCDERLIMGKLYDTTQNPQTFANNSSIRLEYYQALAGYYKADNNMPAYQEMLEKIITAKDTLYEINSAQALAEFQTKYEVQQKEKTILSQKYDLVKKNFLLYGSIILLLLSVIIFYLLFREYRRKQAVKLQQMQEEEKRIASFAVLEAGENERKRIAADLHDNLGVQANAILYNAEVLKQNPMEKEQLAENLHDTAKEMLLNLRETLWAMKTTDISTVDLWLRIINFSKQMGRHYTQLSIISEGEAPADTKISSAKALNIVMIIQEAVQNAIKHAQAKKIIIASTVTGAAWQCSVTDDGNGFDINTPAANDHYGLEHIKQRALASDLGLTVQSKPGKGTSILLSIALQ